jgi:two-component system response regulator GlrR
MVTKRQRASETFSGNRLPAFPDKHPSRLDCGYDIRRLLIVDDDQGVLNLVAKMVSRLGGYQVTTTANAADALLCLADTRYHMVLSDYAMPHMDGYQLADQIREKYFGTRIIIMTGHRDPDLIAMLEHSGIVDGLLFKPFTLNTLKEKLQLADDSYFHRQTSSP